MKNGGPVSDEAVKLLIADTLRLFVGRGRRLSFEDLETATGDEARKLRSYVETPPAAMPLAVFLRVFAVLPPEAFARVARVIGFSACPSDDDSSATVGRVVADAAALVAKGADAMADGRITHTERAELGALASHLLPELTAMAKGGLN